MIRAARSVAHIRVPLLSLVRAALIAALFLPVSASTAPAAGSVSGQITNSVTHVGIAGARVQFFDLNANAGPITVTADGSGNYSQNLPDGSYAVLTQNAQGYINKIWNNISCSAVCNAASLTAVVVSGGAVTGIDFALVPGGGRIAGTITSSATGAPIAGARVFFASQVGGVTFSTATTDASGHYVSEGGSVSGNVFLVTANGQGYQDEAYDNHKCRVGTCNPASLDAVSVTIGVTTNGIDFALDPGGRGMTNADFDGDEKTDIAIWRPSDGIWYVRNSSDGSVTSLPWGSGNAPYNDVPVPGDYDGDGNTDIAIWRPSNGTWYVHNSSNASVTSLPWGSGVEPYNDVPVPGDYDGDGKTDIAIWRPSDGTWYVNNSSDGRMTSLPWGSGAAPYYDVPVPGDYDGDGKTDVAIWRPSNGTWYVHNSSDGSLMSLPWGSGDAPYYDVPVPGDYDGDAKTDIAIWRPSDGTWYVHNSSDGSVTSLPWGSGAAPYNDVPVPGDYDGDGKTDIAIWRPSDGTWYVHNSSNGSVTALPWGSGAAPYHDFPIPSFWTAKRGRY